MTEQLQARGVGPVQIVEHREHRSVPRTRQPAVRPCLPEATAARCPDPRPARSRRPTSGTSRASAPAARAADPRRSSARRRARASKRLDPRLIGDAQVLLGVTEQHRRSFGVARASWAAAPSYPMPGLTRDEHRLATLRRNGRASAVSSDGQLGAATEEPEQRIGCRHRRAGPAAAPTRSPGRFPDTSTASTGPGMPFNPTARPRRTSGSHAGRPSDRTISAPGSARRPPPRTTGQPPRPASPK